MVLFVNDSVTVMFSILAIIVTILLGLVVLWRLKINLKKYRDENDALTEQTISKTEMVRNIEYYIAKVGQFGNFALIYVDLDDFTDLNEVVGRETADKILAGVADRLAESLPYRGSICRYHNDEFLIFIKDELSSDELMDITAQYIEIINEPFKVLQDEIIHINASIGIATYPTCGSNFKELLSNLELASYVSKRDGGNKSTFYYSELGALETANLAYFKEVKDAIKNREFCLFYQPMVNIKSQELFGFEALLRWNHPVHGVLSPFKFITILEQSGDIGWVGLWGFEHLVKQIGILKTKFPNVSLKCSLNLSTKQLLSATIVDDFRKVLKKYKIEANCVILEIAEYAMYEKIGRLKTNLLKLRDLGFLIAVDGFNLDYSALTTIEREPIDIIKLDQDFLDDIENNFMKEKFVSMLVDYALKNNRIVISEGIENLEMSQYVLKQQIEYGQGYLFSVPICEEDLGDFIKYRRWTENMVYTDTKISSEGYIDTTEVTETAK